jgi:hypothetical protein
MAVNGKVSMDGLSVCQSVRQSVYVDELAICYSFQSMVTTVCHLLIVIYHLLHWALLNGFTLSSEKAQYVHFSRLTCELSLDILKVLSCRSLGRDQRVMFRLYCSLI